MLPLVMPYFGEDWRLALGVWALPLIATAVAVAMFAPRSLSKLRPDACCELASAMEYPAELAHRSHPGEHLLLPQRISPARLNEVGHQELISAALTALNAGQVPASFLLLHTADRLQDASHENVQRW